MSDTTPKGILHFLMIQRHEDKLNWYCQYLCSKLIRTTRNEHRQDKLVGSTIGHQARTTFDLDFRHLSQQLLLNRAR